jgi:2-octaprenyl-6-methoxyphenol hydroxylase
VSESAKISDSKIRTDYDIVISGGGVVGCLTAIALATHTSFSVLLLEAVNISAKPATSASQTKRFDARVIALSADSLSTLETLGVNIDDIVHQTIEQIHVSDRGHIGQVKLIAKEQGLAALGKVVAIEALGEYLLNMVKSLSGQIEYKCPLKIKNAKQTESNVTLELSDSTEICTKLLVVSDGGQSKTASLVGMQSQLTSYGQAAIITNIKTQLAHENIAYERFTSQGPIAFLPMNIGASNKTFTQHSMSVVWCLNQQFSEQKLQLSEQDFLQELTSLFGHKLGRLTACSQRYSYPLSLSKSHPFVSYRAISVGNAAQSLHPIAGQGFNLGVRDVAELVKVVKYATDPGEFAAIQQYKKCRQADKDDTVFATEALVKVFSNQYTPFVIARNLGLFALNSFSGPKHQFANFAMGMRKSHD